MNVPIITSRHAEIVWIERRIRFLDAKAVALVIAGQKAAARKLAAERDGLTDCFIALGGTHYQLAA